MNAQEIFKTFVEDLKSKFPDLLSEISYDVKRDTKTIETDFFPHALQIIQKASEFFNERRRLFNISLSTFWKHESSEIQDMIWKNLQLSLLASFLHGDVKEKIGSVIDIIKSYLNKTGQNTDEISKILEDKKSQGYIQEILDYVLNSKIVKIFKEIIEQLDLSDLDINIENPEDIVNLLKNPDHPAIKKGIDKIQNLMKDKFKKGSLKQDDIRNEIETIKAKITGFFGNSFNDILGLKKGETSREVLMGNSPEARRQRMLARLQRKVRDKNSH